MDVGQAGSIAARLDRLPPSRYFVQLVALIAIGGWFEFYEFAMPGGISLGLTRRVFTASAAGLMAWNSFASFLASFFFGMFVGAFLFSWISDRFGRRATFTWSMLIYSIAIFLTAFQNSALVIDLLRFVAGFGISVQLINNDSFISEITPRRWRGRYMAFSILIVLTSGPVALLLSWLLVPHSILGPERLALGGHRRRAGRHYRVADPRQHPGIAALAAIARPPRRSGCGDAADGAAGARRDRTGTAATRL